MPLRLSPGDLVACDGEDCVVGKTTARGQASLLRVSDHDIFWVHVATWASLGRLRLLAEVGNHDVDQDVLFDVTPHEMAVAREIEAHLNEVMFGVPDPAQPDLLPRVGYEIASKMKRREVKAAELAAAEALKPAKERRKVSVRTLERWEAEYLRDGLHALLPRRAAKAGSRGRQVDPAVIEAVVAVLEQVVQGSTVTMLVLASRVRRRLALLVEQEVAKGATREKATARYAVGHRTLLRIIEDYDIHGAAKGAAKRRRNDSNRPGRRPHPIVASCPGEVVEVDSTPINVLALDDNGEVVRLHLGAAIDVATRSVLARSFVVEGADATVHADLLARMLRPQRFREDAPDSMRLAHSKVLPHREMVSMDPELANAMAIPFIVPDTITSDRGTDYLGKTFHLACAHFGISIREAPPRSPTYKPHIERLMLTVDTMLFQHLPGYIGNTVENRGHNIDKGPLLTIWEVIEEFDEFWVSIYQNNPHEGLRDHRFPKVCLSPNQTYRAMFDASPDLPVPINEADYIALMPVHRRKIRHDGIRIANRTYDSELLVDFIGVKPPDADGLWAVRLDPYDLSRCWVQHPENGEWVECLTEAWRRALMFPTSPVTEPGFVAATHQSQEDWAARIAAKYEGRKPMTAKTRGKVSTVTAMRKGDTARPAPTAAPAAPVVPTGTSGGFDPAEFGLVTNEEEY